MTKINWRRVAFLVLVFIFVYFAPTEGFNDDEKSFDERLVIKLSEILKVEPPKRILVERLEQKELLDEYGDNVMSECMSGQMERFHYCAAVARQAVKGSFVHGFWIPEDDPTFLHIKVYKRDGIEAVIHEYLHWYLHHSTNPEGLINNHGILTPMVNALLTSAELIEWLDKEGK